MSVAPGGDATIGVVLVTHQSAGDLPATLGRLAPQLRPGDRVVVVDNASTDGSAEVAARLLPDATVVASTENRGFAGGCRVGADACSTELLLLLNPDTVPAEDLLERIRATAAAQPLWGAWQALVLLPGEQEVNTAGNLVHFLGFGWAGGNGESVASAPSGPTTVGFASGAAMSIRRVAWDAADGFQDHYFMYGEDLDLSLRLRLQGWEVGVDPAQRVVHDYEFTKGDYKWFHLERNRWWTVVGTYPTRMLLLLLPALIAFELALLPVAFRAGWGRPKLRALGTVLRELPAMLRHRRRVQATTTVEPRVFAAALTSSLDSPFLGAANAVPGVAAAQGLYWRLVLRLL